MRHRRELYLIVATAIAVVAMLFMPTGFENPSLRENKLYEKGRVTEVDNSEISQISIVNLGEQYLTIHLLSGPFKGDTVSAINTLLGDKKRDKIFEVGDKALCVVRVNSERSQIEEVRAEELYRQDLELILLAIFIIALTVFAGRTGAKAALSFIFTALAFWKLLLPALLRGYPPLLVSVAIVTLSTTVIILLVGGISRRGFVALLGSVIGVVVTALLAMLFGSLFKIPGTIADYSDALLYAGFSSLNFSDMFLSCIFISSAGAVMDIAMDISAAQDELRRQAPQLSSFELIKSGLNIAAPVVGSMTTTLLFAYSGSFMFTFLAFIAQGVPIESIVNRGYIASEILLTMVGSFGLVLVAPITALLGGYIFKHNNKK